MQRFVVGLGLAVVLFWGGAGISGQDEAALHRRAIVIDTHVDTPQRMLFERGFDFAARHQDGQLDLPRMREGGLDAAFFRSGCRAR